ncbi:MAG: iron-containing alcohol dehydrogenase family protein [Halobacteriaceae archaeon]
MNGVTDGSRFEYDPGVVVHGRGRVASLGEELDRRGLERALVVCGRTVGSTRAVVEPVERGLGDRLAGVFARTTPEKLLRTAVDAAAAFREADADALVGLGGGSSLDVATVASALATPGDERSYGELARELAATGTVAVPDGDPPPVVAVPTTLAGAGLSQGAGVNAAPRDGGLDEPASGGVSDPRLFPAAAFYDPDLFATTPPDVLAGSAMNGFDKGVETLYARAATPVTDATATRGLSLLREALPALGRDPGDGRALERVVEGTLLVQYGVSRPDATTLSVLHAFGHGLRRRGGVQQGVAHAVVAPAVLRYVFERVDGRRGLLADALGVPRADRSDAEVAAGVVGAVAGVRDALGLPARLRAVEGVERDDLPAVAAAVAGDGLLENCPPGLDPTAEDALAVLRRAW